MNRDGVVIRVFVLNHIHGPGRKLFIEITIEGMLV